MAAAALIAKSSSSAERRSGPAGTSSNRIEGNTGNTATQTHRQEKTATAAADCNCNTYFQTLKSLVNSWGAPKEFSSTCDSMRLTRVMSVASQCSAQVPWVWDTPYSRLPTPGFQLHSPVIAPPQATIPAHSLNTEFSRNAAKTCSCLTDSLESSGPRAMAKPDRQFPSIHIQMLQASGYTLHGCVTKAFSSLARLWNHRSWVRAPGPVRS